MTAATSLNNEFNYKQEQNPKQQLIPIGILMLYFADLVIRCDCYCCLL